MCLLPVQCTQTSVLDFAGIHQALAEQLLKLGVLAGLEHRCAVAVEEHQVTQEHIQRKQFA
jgi:hypothetical protein